MEQRGALARGKVVAACASTALAAAIAALLAACSLLAPSRDALEGAYAPALDGAAPADAPPGTCPLGTKACGSACVSTSAPTTGCAAAACTPCSAPHGAALCVAGACALGPCENGWANCNARADDGCEVDTASSSQFCGSCLTSCGASTPRCEQASCVPRCAAVKLTSTAAHVSFPSVGMGLGTGDFTIEVWLAWHTAFVRTHSSYVLTTNETFGANAIELTNGPGTILCAANPLAPTGAGVLATPIPEDGTFHHVACVRTAGVLSLYVDGVPRAQASNTSAILAPAGGAGAFGQPSGIPAAGAPPINLGPARISRVARYNGAFTPRAFWGVDGDTVAQWLTSRGFDGTTIHDEAGGNHDGAASTGVIATTETPCP